MKKTVCNFFFNNKVIQMLRPPIQYHVCKLRSLYFLVGRCLLYSVALVSAYNSVYDYQHTYTSYAGKKPVSCSVVSDSF